MALNARHAPATQRNREPILEVLERILPPTGTVLEVASGTGEHAVFFAPRLQPRQWLPSDVSLNALESIVAWGENSECSNLHPPVKLDASASRWTIETKDAPQWVVALLKNEPLSAIASINMIHISPWESCLGLMAGAGRLLPAGGKLYLYGPFRQGGKHTAPSNEAFDESLRSQNPAWGVRNLEDVVAVAKQHHLTLQETVAMPANNLSVIFSHN